MCQEDINNISECMCNWQIKFSVAEYVMYVVHFD